MRKELAKTYSPAEFEDRLYAFWNESGFFGAEPDPDKKPFTIVIPPPNITGQLHMGHALDNTLQDIIIRTKRMQGYSTLWVPGTDHASIATEAKIVEAMRKEGLSKEDLGREAFLERAWAWKEQYGGRIIEQLKKLGSSCDWSRERFTMDEGCSRAVREVFVRLWEKGLIYRGERIINWCPHCKTSISNAEVDYDEQEGCFWHIRYPLVGGGGYMEVATTRPETMLGDTAVAVNPDDERYKQLIGRYCILPLVGRRIPIVADEHAQPDKGTGCVKITPAHDPNDFEVGRRRHLPMEVALTEDAKITDNYPKYAGMDRYEARKAIVEDLKAGGYLAGIENITHEVGTCYRCGTTIEPMISLQWFVQMEPLAKPAIEAVRDGRTKFVPERFEKNYFNWMENTQDWCISRQLWWGHRIPAFYCGDCGHIEVSREDIGVCPECGGGVTRDPDTLDTWFSSALWPFSTLGWPDKTADLDYFYPTNTLVTGYDIITFWVSRMIFSALEHTGQVPFDTVLIHGLVRDAQGRKMSKSLGNGIDPLDIIDKYGADALRFALATGNSPGNDMRFSDEKIEAARNFSNKIWNAARFILMNLTGALAADEDAALPDELKLEDEWILSLYNTLVGEVTENMENYELGVALQKLYEFIWDIFCDWYIELLKPRLSAGDVSAQRVIVYVFTNTLKLLHPFMPFITEEIWQSLPHAGQSIMISDYPATNDKLNFPEAQVSMDRIITAIRAVRNRRSEMNVPPSRKAHLVIVTDRIDSFSEDTAVFFTRLSSASAVEIKTSAPELEEDDSAVRIITDSASLYIPMGDLVDTEKEIERLSGERQKTIGEIERLEKKLSNKGFTEKAPAAVVEGERVKLAQYKDTLTGIDNALSKLK
ncbi:MAG: valine--tRNA ligase [Clostridiales bacterium]|nr:valine--tRNA ligase [Clostridiales bacterium]